MTYNEAIQELEGILRSLETDQIDVDDLTTRAERSAELIRLCRQKLRHAEASLDHVFDSLDEDDEDEADETDDEEDEDAEDTEDDMDDDNADDEPEEFRPSPRNRPSAPRLF